MAYNDAVLKFLEQEGGITVTVQTEKERWSKEGKVFEASALISLTGGQEHYSIIETGGKDFVLFSRAVAYDEDGVEEGLFRNSTWTGGTPGGDIVYNTNDKSPVETTITTTLGVTITDLGDKSAATKYVFGGDANANNGGFYETVFTEQIVPANSSLTLYVKNRDTVQQNVALHLVWAEVEL